MCFISIRGQLIDDSINFMPSLIGITAGEIHNARFEWSPVVYGQSHTYTDAMVHAGGVPVIIPFIEDEAILKKLYQKLDGILFAGGNDINPSLYGEKPLPTTEEFSDKRDAMEAKLMQWAIEDNKPVLCICRGMQLLNVVCGGQLYQHLPDDLPGIDHEASTKNKSGEFLAHPLRVIAETKLDKILSSPEIATNAHHHQGVKRLGKGLKASAHTTDGLIEAVEHVNNKFAVGIQSHPESLERKVVPEWAKLFRAFVESCE